MRKPPNSKRGFGFFQTPLGRKITFLAAGATTVGLFMGNYLPHTFGLKYYKDFMQCYQNGIPRPVPDKVLARLERAMDILELHGYERKLIKPFTVFGFDLFQAGSTKYRFGCVLGIPVNFSYSNPGEINHHDIRFRDKEIKWNSESGKLLQEAIVLSEDEQVFGFCKSILLLQTHRVMLNSLFPSICFLSMYTIGRYLNVRLDLFARPLGLRLVMYGILGLFGLGSWSFMKDFNQVSYDTEIDTKLSAMGPEFVTAGMQYYDKLLKKNMALRELTGDDVYTAKGNENYILRQKSLPLTIRKSYFEQKWKEMQHTETNDELVN